MKMRKFITFILLIGILSFPLSACGSKPTPATPIETISSTTGLTKPVTPDTPTQATADIITVNQVGGTFHNSDSSVVMKFANGSVNAETHISITPNSNLADAPGYLSGTTYTFEPEGTVFNQPVQLTIKYDPVNIPINLPETMLYLAKLTNNSWQPIEGSKVDTTNKTVTASIAGFSTYGLVGSDMTVTFESPTCFPGTEVTITPNIQNAPPGYKLQYKWSTDGKYGDLIGTPDEKTGSINYKAKVNAPDRSTEKITLEIFTYFATADNPPKYTHYTWLTASTTVTMNFPTLSLESKVITPDQDVTLTPVIQNSPPGYRLQYKWSCDQKYGTLTPNPDGSEAIYHANADAPDGAIENITVELFTQFATGDTPPILTDYTWDKATATITIGTLSFTFDLVQTTSAGTVITHVWVSHHKMKWVTGPAGEEVIHLFDYDAHIEYWYTGNNGTKSAIDPSEKSMDDPDYLSQFAPYTNVGTGKIDGNLCQIIQSVKNGTTTKIWIWQEKNLPLRYQTTVQGTVITIDYQNYQFVSIPDSEFLLPSNVTIR
jgi:outer membrane lipoprotein-sorting protein